MPRRDTRSYAWDMLRALDLVVGFAKGKTFGDYQSDAMLRSAVERQLIVVGEALAQLTRYAPDIAAGIPQSRRIVAFRNILVHGYAVVQSRIVWDTVLADVPMLREHLRSLLAEAIDPCGKGPGVDETPRQS